MRFKRILSFFLLYVFTVNSAVAGITIVKSNGISLTGADGIRYVETSGISLTGADGLLNYKSNGISLTGADGISLTGADGISLTGADGATYTGANGISLTGADGISLTGADGISLTGADGVISLTGADGVVYTADSILIRGADGISLTGADGISLTGADGISLTGADGISLTGADGISLTGADGISLTGADTITGFNANGVVFTLVSPTGISLTGADGPISLTGADGISLTGADGVIMSGINTGGGNSPGVSGLQSLDPELAMRLNQMTDDSNVNAVITFHQYPSQTDFAQLQQLGIVGGTLYRVLPMILVTATRSQLIAVSRLPQVRSIYGNRTLTVNSDPYFNKTQIQRVVGDQSLRTHNSGLPVSGRNVTVAVLDTGVNSQHNDLAGKVVQNVRLNDTQSAAVGFVNPLPVENLPNTDLIAGHGTFVAGVIAGSGVTSGGRYNGVAPGAKILGLSAGDLNLTHVLAGFDYILERGANYNVRVVNCSFSAATVYDESDPVNIATKTLTTRGVNVVFSAGNSGAGNGTLNPYAAAPWVVSVGATDEQARLAGFSSRGVFGSSTQNPSIVAPGVNVVGLRSLATQTSVFGLGTADAQRLTPGELPFYTTASGTSFSAPQVAGAIALMLEANPNLSPAEIKDILQRSATPLPLNYRHEVGAGMLNTYAAVLEAAFPLRRTGLFRATLETNAVKFATSITQTFNQTVTPGAPATMNVSIPENTVQASVNITWGLGANDLGLKVYDTNGMLRGESNNLNLPVLTGRREKVNLSNPASRNYQAAIRHTNNIGTTQNVFGLVEASTVEYAIFNDVRNLPLDAQNIIYDSLRTYVMLPEGKKFRSQDAVSRQDLAAALVRGGRVPQFVAMNPMFTDITDLTGRSIIESVQSNPTGALIYDAPTGSAFRPDNSATKLIAAVALVKAANLEGLAAGMGLPLNVTDAGAIPAQWRGYVAVALQKGFLTLDGNKFNPGRSINRFELAQAMNKLVRLEN